MLCEKCLEESLKDLVQANDIISTENFICGECKETCTKLIFGREIYCIDCTHELNICECCGNQ